MTAKLAAPLILGVPNFWPNTTLRSSTRMQAYARCEKVKIENKFDNCN